MKTRNDNVLSLATVTDHTGSEGCFVDASGVLLAAATAAPYALILDGAPANGRDAVHPCCNGSAFPVTVKLNSSPGTVVRGTKLVLHTDGTSKADSGSGARVIVAEAQGPGAASELIEAILVPPVVFAS